MEYGVPVYRREFLVDPEAHFDEFNIGIHGITPNMVHGAPRFDEVWREIAPLFGGVVAAHNATFDLAVICKMLARHDVEIPPLTYVCTLLKSRRHLPKEACGSHKLNDLCAGLEIPLEHHHDSLDDALACALILERLVDDYGCDESDLHRYVYTGTVWRVGERVAASALADLGQTLFRYGGGRISEEYHEALEDWTRKNDKYLKNAAVRRCLDAVQCALKRGEMELSEYNTIMGETGR